jgi:ribulose-phosphate 3-epimerase
MNIYPSLMVVPQQELCAAIESLAPYCAGFHLDVMDGIFVADRFWYDADQLNKVIHIAQRVWIHLMVQKPESFYQHLMVPDESLVSFHIESDADIFTFSKIIKEKKQRVSLAMSPKTPITEIIPFLNVIDHVLIMSVEPGHSGKYFLESSYEKIEELMAYRATSKMNFAIGVDGGINQSNIIRLAQQGINDCAIATALFGQRDHLGTLQELRKIV